MSFYFKRLIFTLTMNVHVHVSVGAHAWPKAQGAGVTSGTGLEVVLLLSRTPLC